MPPHCIECGEEYNPKRFDLGYKTCLDCGSPKKEFLLIPMPKSNYVVGNPSDLIGIAGSHKGR